MRAKAATVAANSIRDANFVNFYGPSGLTPNAKVGNLVRIIAGMGAGQPTPPSRRTRDDGHDQWHMGITPEPHQRVHYRGASMAVRAIQRHDPL